MNDSKAWIPLESLFLGPLRVKLMRWHDVFLRRYNQPPKNYYVFKSKTRDSAGKKVRVKGVKRTRPGVLQGKENLRVRKEFTVKKNEWRKPLKTRVDHGLILHTPHWNETIRNTEVSLKGGFLKKHERINILKNTVTNGGTRKNTLKTLLNLKTHARTPIKRVRRPFK